MQPKVGLLIIKVPRHIPQILWTPSQGIFQKYYGPLFSIAKLAHLVVTRNENQNTIEFRSIFNLGILDGILNKKMNDMASNDEICEHFWETVAALPFETKPFRDTGLNFEKEYFG